MATRIGEPDNAGSAADKPGKGGPKRFVIPGVVIGIAVAIVLLLTFGVIDNSDASSIDSQVARHHFPQAPSYTTRLPVLNSNKTMSLSAFRGHYVLLNMFASWCDPCHAEAPTMAREEKFLDAHHADLVGVAYKDLSFATANFDRTYGLHETVLRDVSGDFAHSFGTFQVPETFLINPQGKIIALKREIVTMQWLKTHVQPVIDKHDARA